jgi:hypothetical protein
MNRLSNKCYADKFDALHVDQKWMDFIPAFFPNETLVTHHLGINPAIWNLHERELIIDGNEEYKIRDISSKEIFPLLFFHFSGFDPFKPALINRRHPKYNTDVYPSYIPLFDEYIKGVYKNGYNKYSKMTYSFNSFEDGENILPLHRRLFRVSEQEYLTENPFSANSSFVKTLKDKKLLSGIKSKGFSIYTDDQRSKRGMFEKLLISGLKVLKFIVGIQYYASFIIFLNDYSRLEKQIFLLKKND